VFLSFVLIIALLVGRFAGLGLEFADVGFVTVGVVIGTDNSAISWDDLAIFNNDLNREKKIIQCTSGTIRGSIDLRCHREPIL